MKLGVRVRLSVANILGQEDNPHPFYWTTCSFLMYYVAATSHQIAAAYIIVGQIIALYIVSASFSKWACFVDSTTDTAGLRLALPDSHTYGCDKLK